MNPMEAIYQQFCRWCKSIGVTPMPYEAWLQVRCKTAHSAANQFSFHVK